MEQIKIFVEGLISLTGLTGDAVPILRHVSLVLVAIVLAAAAGLLCRKILVPVITRLTAKTEARWDDVVFNRRVLISACHIVPAIVIWQLLPWVFYQFPVVREVLARATAIYIVVMMVRTLLVLFSSVKELEGERRTSTQQYLLSFLGILRVVMLFLAAIIVVAILFNRNPVTLLAGLGATSAILMLVFQDTIKGLVAGIRLTSNDMLHKGDWITVPKAGANGVVEDMSLTTVKIRNFDNTIVTVTPQTLVDDSFQNWQGMQESDGRRVARTVYFDFRSIRLVDEPLKQQLVEKGFFRPEEIKGELDERAASLGDEPGATIEKKEEANGWTLIVKGGEMYHQVYSTRYKEGKRFELSYIYSKEQEGALGGDVERHIFESWKVR